jgi:hypothetical protein
VEEGEQQPPEIVNVNEIPSLDTTPVNPTPILEETKQPTSKGTNIDIPAKVWEPQNHDAKTLKEVQPENIEVAPEVNGMVPNLEAAVQPDESQMIISYHPPEGMVEYVTGCPEWYFEEQPEFVGTSSQPPPLKKYKLQIPRSPHKQPLTKIILPRIPYGVQVGPDLLGHIGKLKYSKHDVADEDKFLKLAKRVYLEIVGTNRVGEPIHQLLQWETRLQKTRILGLVDLPHFGCGQYATSCFKHFLVVTHGGDIWLDNIVSIDVELIANIIGLPSWGMDPA